MLYVLAAVGALTIAVLLWRAFGVQTASVSSRRTAPIAPDDDPEFLRGLDKFRKRDEDGLPPNGS
ncbi:hypothetical protein [Actinokineospora iranica]|uniref:Uncharacterized protein n=1 Tax=Actinokineospora iranica TaxID=1271860 RepID=A0A1G6UQG5_9PSEU|nr:hypothetical protein [Actinokineospora iranica]SDD43582.1 hypothetical protein SAMN05216174_11146 [Actinokineospora iranica]